MWVRAAKNDYALKKCDNIWVPAFFIFIYCTSLEEYTNILQHHQQ